MTEASILSGLYYNPESGAAYAGVDRLHGVAKRQIPNLSRKAVRDWLSSQITYTLHKQPRHSFQRRRIIVSRINEVWEADLVDLQMYAKQNRGFKYILVVIDVFSKQLHVRPLKNKTGATVVAAFKELFAVSQPESLRTDSGLEFKNQALAALLKAYSVQQTFARNPKTKACVAERVNRSLKERMFRHFTKNGTRNYIDVLQSLVNGYNQSYHRTIKTTPSKVTADVMSQVFENTYGYANEREMLRAQQKLKRKNVLAIGQLVRIKYHLNPMDKRYLPNWSDRLYKVTKVFHHDVTVYKVRGIGEPKDEVRRYYRQELQPIKDSVERVTILERDDSRGRVKVRWTSTPNVRPVWIPVSDLQDL